MLMKMRSRMQNQKGFTLVELMVVVVILGILVAIAVPIYNSVSTNAKEKACASNVRIIEGAIEMYKAEHGSAPANNDALEGTYVKEWPVCPFDTEEVTNEYTVENGVLNHAAH